MAEVVLRHQFAEEVRVGLQLRVPDEHQVLPGDHHLTQPVRVNV